MPYSPTRAEHRAIARRFEKSIEVIEAARMAWANDAPHTVQLGELVEAKREIMRLLAQYVDCTYVFDEDDWNRTVMERYEIIASDLLEGITRWMQGGDCDEQVVRVTKGRYVVSRFITINETKYMNERACFNPAVARRQLDEWEAQLRLTMEPMEYAA